MTHARLWPTADKPSNNGLQWEGFVASNWMSEQPWHTQNRKELLPYLWGLQHSHGVRHSSKRLICLLDIDGKFVESIWGWGTRLHRGFKCQGVENKRVRKPTTMGHTKTERSKNAWLESMQWTCVLWLQGCKKIKMTRGGLWKRWLHNGAALEFADKSKTLTNSICIHCWESS